MTPSSLQWWGWLLIAGVLWLAQLMVTNNEDKLTPWVIRASLIVAMFISFGISVIRFVKWVWQ